MRKTALGFSLLVMPTLLPLAGGLGRGGCVKLWCRAWCARHTDPPQVKWESGPGLCLDPHLPHPTGGAPSLSPPSPLPPPPLLSLACFSSWLDDPDVHQVAGARSSVTPSCCLLLSLSSLTLTAFPALCLLVRCPRPWPGLSQSSLYLPAWARCLLFQATFSTVRGELPQASVLRKALGPFLRTSEPSPDSTKMAPGARPHCHPLTCALASCSLSQADASPLAEAACVPS